MTKAEKRVVRAAMRWSNAIDKALLSASPPPFRDVTKAGDALRKACAALSRKK